MRQFCTYLRSELGKLKNHGDAARFLSCIEPQVLETCQLQTDPAQLVIAFSTQEKVDAFVHVLSPDQLQALTRSCDLDWRKNGVFDKLSRHSTWTDESVSVDLVDVQQGEPQLGYIFQRHGFRLTSIAADGELWTQKPYADWNLDAAVHFSTGLGKLTLGRYRLFDGVHRAILRCRQGIQSLEICFYEA